jgi:HEAT repeat protein
MMGPKAAEAVPALMVLRESNSSRSDEAARVLKTVIREGEAPPDTASALIAAAGYRDVHLRLGAARALGWQGEQAAKVAPVLRKLMGDENPSVRAVAAGSLWRLTGRAEESCRVLAEVLESADEDGWCEAARALGRIGPAAGEALPGLEAAFKERPGRAAVAAAGAFWRITGRKDRAVRELIAALDHQSAWVRMKAALELAELGPAAGAALSKLKQLDREDKYWDHGPYQRALRAIRGGGGE